MPNKIESASIIIASFNNKNGLKKVLDAMLKQDFNSDYEIIVVDDGSTDGTPEMLAQEFSNKNNVTIIAFTENRGVCKARNAGIRKAKYPIVVNMDHDCVPGKKWLQQMVSGFSTDKVGIVSAYGGYGGTSTAFRKKLLDQVQGYDESYAYYREDTDLSFKIMELGYKFKHIQAEHNPLQRDLDLSGVKNKLGYFGKRLRYHMNDVLLYKKHPTPTCKEFLHIKYGFLVSPWWDFSIATNLWEKKNEIALKSPRGITVLENKSFLHFLVIITLGLLYMFSVKSARLIASIKFGKLLL